MKLFLAPGAVGTIALLLLSAADASSQYRNPRSSGIDTNYIREGTSSRSRRRRRTQSAVHRDDYNDDDYHRSLSSDTWEGGSGYSSASSLNDNWNVEESSSSSSFYDFEDIKQNHKKKNKSNSIDETERILLALERKSREEDDELEQSNLSIRKKRRKRKGSNSLLSSSSSSSPPKSFKKKRRRRKRKVTKLQTKGHTLSSGTRKSDKENTSRIKESPSARRAFVSKPASASRKSPSTVSGKATTRTVGISSSNPSSGEIPQPQSHPDRTTWEVPSYSHKVSTMIKNKNNESKPKIPRRASTKTLPRDIPNPSSSSSIGSFASTARTTVATAATARSTRKKKPTAAAAAAPTTPTPQSSTLGSSTTPWVRKFLAGRPKDRLLPLPRDYISDNFNLAQLAPIVERIGYQAMGDDAIPVAKALQQHRTTIAASGASQQTPTRSTSYPIYRRALHSILVDPSADDASENDDSTDEDLIIPPYAIQKASEALYLLLHARFVISPRGLEAIRHVMALDNTVFGKCPRSCCKGTGLLPYGYSNDYTSDASVPTVTTASRKEHDSCCHRYCPSCGEVWISWESKTDGCAWGPSWCHLFLLAFGSQVYAKELEEAAAASQAPQRPQSQTSTPMVRSFLPRGIGSRGASATSNDGIGSDVTSEDLSRPTPSVFGFRIHPSTDFGSPFNEPSLRGGSND